MKSERSALYIDEGIRDVKGGNRRESVLKISSPATLTSTSSLPGVVEAWFNDFPDLDWSHLRRSMPTGKEPPWSAPASRRLDWTPLSARPGTWRSSSVSPCKRVRLSTPSYGRRAVSLAVGDCDDEDIRLARSDSVSKLQAVWSAIEEKAQDDVSSDGDDVIDLETGEVIEDHGYMRYARRKPIGIFAMGGKMRESSTDSSEAEGSDDERLDTEEVLQHLGSGYSLTSLHTQSKSSPAIHRRASPVSAMSPLATRFRSQILRDTPAPDQDSGDELDLIASSSDRKQKQRSPSRMVMPPPPVPMLKGSTRSVFSHNVPFPTPPPSNSTGSPAAASPPPRKEATLTAGFSPPPSRLLFSMSASTSVVLSQTSHLCSPSKRLRSVSPSKASGPASSKDKQRAPRPLDTRRRSVPCTFVTAAEQRARSVSVSPKRSYSVYNDSSYGSDLTSDASEDDSDEDIIGEPHYAEKAEVVHPDSESSSSSSPEGDASIDDGRQSGDEARSVADIGNSRRPGDSHLIPPLFPPIVRYNHRRYVPWVASQYCTE